ncbi:hypothetical protein [Streptomyces sp. NPDC086023]|uniref:hypothetical protein n=1 Tax=Streptomyces sp. NPDC086023 TaxID=3365746 RepID=UPI0037D7791A
MTDTDTPTPAKALAALEQARTETGEARALAEALAERVRSGDAEVTPHELAEAQQLAEFAALRITAAERKHRAALAVDRDARGHAVAADARALADRDDAQGVAAAVRDVAEAVARLVHLADTRQDRVRAVGSAVEALAVELAAEHPDRRALGRHMRDRYKVTGDPTTVTVHEPYARIRAVHTADLIAAAVALGLPDLSLLPAVHESLQGAEAAATRAMDAVPAVAADWRLTPSDWQALDPAARHRAERLGLAPEAA